ncbi:Uncharacterised protein [Mycobacteroides abscessus subsp. bolletii]|nr:Uncharacterised protein [Mycobacteroides abscessus subsp. bolletii]SKS02819.1 Uncharacterised protein [Mycobacteroides abscessus subsp. bolletii]DAZ90182.1 TPA_asm: hypothetical protein PROPHIFVLQ01-1_96 [Mycobacterium phage prophiFVLQ01-1]
MTLQGTVWIRKSDGVQCRVIGDAESASGRGNRSIRMKNLKTGREFWATPEGLGRKYAKPVG